MNRTGDGRKGKRTTESGVVPGGKLLRGDLSPSDPKSLLVPAKYTRPVIGGKRILRPRLLSRLNEGLDKRITLIVAPAGCGKTTLAAQWLDHAPLRSAWVSLERDDSEPQRFLWYLIAGIRTVVPEFGSKIERLLSTPHLPPPEYLAEAMISELGTLTAPLLLVLDDFHLIVSPALREMVIRILKHRPASLQVAILTRVDPPWPLARWRAAGWLNELRAADLSFSIEETEAFFEGHHFTPETVGILQKRTEGWPAGLQLINLSIADAEDPERLARTFSDKDRLLVDYLMEEVISHQPSDVRDFLSVTAMPDRFCAPLSDMLLADEGKGEYSRTMISRLEQQNLFIIPLDRERYWYRYHHLFRNFLEHHLTSRMPRDRTIHLRRSAGKWFAGQGMAKEAIKEYLSAGDLDEAAALLELNLHAAIDEDLSRRSLGRLLDLFPPEAERMSPVLLVGKAYVKLGMWEFTAVMQLLDQAEALLRGGPNRALPKNRRVGIQGDIEVQRGMCSYWAGDMERAHRDALKAVRIVPKEHGFASSVAIVYATLSYAMKGKRDKGLTLLSAYITQGVADRSQFIGAPLVAQMGIHFYAGDLDAVLASAHQMLAIHKTVQIPDYWLAYAYYFQGSVAYERNQQDAAADLFHSVIEKPYRVPVPMYHDSLIGLALLALARGEVQEARNLVRSASEFAVEVNAPASLETSRAMAFLMANSAGEATADPVRDSTVNEGVLPWLLVPSIIRIESVILRGTPADCNAVLKAIEAGLRRANRYHNARQTIQFLTLKAVALKRAGCSDEALSVLKKVLRMAEPPGFVRTFVDRGPIMAELLTAILGKTPENPYVRSLLAAFEKSTPPGTSKTESSKERQRPPAGPEEALSGPAALSRRELEVLILLEEPLTNKEIAARLFVSPETVKKHIFNISRKLNTRGRRKTIATARQSGLLPGG